MTVKALALTKILRLKYTTFELRHIASLSIVYYIDLRPNHFLEMNMRNCCSVGNENGIFKKIPVLVKDNGKHRSA